MSPHFGQCKGTAFTVSEHESTFRAMQWLCFYRF
jgi:hypothetical protein